MLNNLKKVKKRANHEITAVVDFAMKILRQNRRSTPSTMARTFILWRLYGQQVDSGAATSCLPVEMCRKMGLSILKTTHLPYTTASGQPVHVHGVCTPSVTLGAASASITGTGEFKAINVAKPLLSVAKLVQKGGSVNFTPKGASLKAVVECIRFHWMLQLWKARWVFQGTALGKSLTGPRTIG